MTEMTDNEAIAWIKSIKDKYIHGGDDDFDEKRKKSLDMAIKSIEALDKLDSIIVEQLDNSTDFKECMTLRWVLDKMSEVIE